MRFERDSFWCDRHNPDATVLLVPIKTKHGHSLVSDIFLEYSRISIIGPPHCCTINLAQHMLLVAIYYPHSRTWIFLVCKMKITLGLYLSEFTHDSIRTRYLNSFSYYQPKCSIIIILAGCRTARRFLCSAGHTDYIPYIV